MPSLLSLSVPPGFSFRHTVCSYGYFLLAPNRWDPLRQALHTSVAHARSGVLALRIEQPDGSGSALRILCDHSIDSAGRRVVKAALSRALRLDHELPGWRRANPAAHRRGFGRLIRSASLFEDMVKTITGCNVTWRNTIVMNRLLVEHFGGGAFPSPERLAGADPAQVKQLARVGYRAERIVQLAQRFVDGSLRADWFESPQRTTDELREALLMIHGFGPYAAANVLQLLGRYDHLPIDTETYRHYCLHHAGEDVPRTAALDARIRAHYDRYHPYQFLAFWYELWRDYERRYGDAWTWDPATTGANFTAAVLRREGEGSPASNARPTKGRPAGKRRPPRPARG